MDAQALSGLKVVEYGSFISAAYCAKLMADLGAEVIKVEEPNRGDETRRHGPFPNDVPHPERSGLFLYLNTNKLGITLNVKVPTGRKILKQLLKEADVFVENNQPKQMTELGLDYAALREVNPHLVMTSITPYGQTGPYRDYKGYAINTGVLGGQSTVGEAGREPLTLPMQQSHLQGGAMGAMATFGALLAREATGFGQHVDVSEVDVWATMNYGHGVHASVFKGQKVTRPMKSIYPLTILPCKDGHIVLIAIQGFQWKRFLEVMGNPEWTRDPRFQDRQVMGQQYADELDSLVETWLIDHTKEEIFELCRQGQIPFAPVRNIAEVVNDPHFEQRGYFVEIAHPEAGELKYPGAPYKLSRTPWQLSRPAPLLGEHNKQVYCDRLGYSREELVRLRRAGII